MLDDNIVCLTVLLSGIDLLVNSPGTDGLSDQVPEFRYPGDVRVLRVVGVHDANEVALGQDLEEMEQLFLLRDRRLVLGSQAREQRGERVDHDQAKIHLELFGLQEADEMREQDEQLVKSEALLDLESVLQDLLDALLLLVGTALRHEVAQNEPNIAAVHVVGCVNVQACDVAGGGLSIGAGLEHGKSGQF